MEAAFDQGYASSAFDCHVNLSATRWLVGVDYPIVLRDFGIEPFDEFMNPVNPLLKEVGGLRSRSGGVS